MPGRLVGDRPFTFDRSALAGAEAARSPRLEVRELVPEALPAPDPEPADVELADLHEFFRHPVRGFFRSRLHVSTPYDADEAKDSIPIDLDNLEQWAVGDRLVADVLGGADPRSAMLAEQFRGLLPPQDLGVGVLDSVVRKVRPLVERALPLRAGPPRTLDVDIDLGDRRLTGTVGNVFGNNLVAVSFSNLGAKHRLAAWLDALALGAGHPDENWTAHTVGKHRTGGQVAMIRPLPEHQAREWLRQLIDVHDRGQCEPLPLPVKTSLAYAEDYRFAMTGRDADPDIKAEREWTTPRFNESGFPREDQDTWHVRAFGEHPPYSLLRSPLRGDESGPAPHRLAHYAWLTWGPLLSDGHELVRSL